MTESIFEKIKKYVLYCGWLIPLFSGIMGYCVNGPMNLIDGIYASIALFFVNPVTTDIHNPWVFIAEYTGVIFTATVILDVIFFIFKNAGKWWDLRWSDSTAIYTDEDDDIKEILKKEFRHGFIINEEDSIEDDAKRHIVMFRDDSKSLHFFSSHKNHFTGQKVYMVLNEIDSSLLRGLDDKELEFHYINRFDLMARQFWKENSLYDQIISKKLPKPYKIGIVGFGSAGRAIFRFGFINNLYALDQEIEYHIWDIDYNTAEFVSSLDTMNKDIIFVHKESPLEQIAQIADMNRVIIADQDDKLAILQNLLYINLDLPIYYYSEKTIDLESILAAGGVICFGDLKDILNEDNIINERLYRMGKLFNYDYILDYNRKHKKGMEKIINYNEDDLEKEWLRADGYGKESSIARADHYYIERRLIKDHIASVDKISEMEHIRWCRFLFVNHYKQGNVAKSERKRMRRHSLLIPYSDLAEEEKSKDSINDAKIQEELDKELREET